MTNGYFEAGSSLLPIYLYHLIKTKNRIQ